MKKAIIMAVTLVLISMISLSTYSQVSGSMEDLVKNKGYKFLAQSANPSRGGLRQLDPGYEVIITKDSLQSYLPYFGRTYNAPLDPSQSGIQFTSTDYEYTVKDRKKGGWDVQVKPKDYKDVRILQFSIFDNGSASLIVTSNNRESISFNGRIEERK